MMIYHYDISLWWIIPIYHRDVSSWYIIIVPSSWHIIATYHHDISSRYFMRMYQDGVSSWYIIMTHYHDTSSWYIIITSIFLSISDDRGCTVMSHPAPSGSHSSFAVERGDEICGYPIPHRGQSPPLNVGWESFTSAQQSSWPPNSNLANLVICGMFIKKSTFCHINEHPKQYIPVDTIFNYRFHIGLQGNVFI